MNIKGIQDKIKKDDYRFSDHAVKRMNQEVIEMKCVFCGGKVEKKKVTFSYEDDDKYLFVEHVPADVCTKCGEKMYSPEVTDELLGFAREESKPVKTVNVPVYNFTRHQ